MVNKLQLLHYPCSLRTDVFGSDSDKIPSSVCVICLLCNLHWNINLGALACGVVKYVRYVSHVHYRFVFCKSRSIAALPLHHLHHPPRTTYYLVLTDGNDNHKNDVVGPYRYCC